MNENNLIPNSERTPQELREMTRKGGIASGEARRRKKTAREFAEAALNAEVTDKGTGKKIVVKDVIIQKLIQRAIQEQDLNTVKYLFELINESPTPKIEVTGRDGERLFDNTKPMSRKEAAELLKRLQEE